MSSEEESIAAYLRTTPIAPILEQSDENQSLIALKVMAVLDNEMNRNGLYNRIDRTNSDTLLMQLLQFHTFQSFKYYDYVLRREIKRLTLRCTVCGLFGPFTCILSHMAINHDSHIGLKMCLYCDRVEMQKHFENHSLDRCYVKYLREQNITASEKIVCEIVAEFYDMLRKISDKFSIITTRNQTYSAKR